MAEQIQQGGVLSVFGTRPEAIKMAPVIDALRRSLGRRSVVCVTGQHRELLDQVLDCFEVVPDVDLRVMEPDQELHAVAAKVLSGVHAAIEQFKPRLVLVQGDTTTSFAAALAAFYSKVPVGHVEAGLRTGLLAFPWPEEGNRRLTSVVAAIHFAPTAQARMNLMREGVPHQAIEMTGNTVVDAVLHASRLLREDARYVSVLNSLTMRTKRFVLVTVHRRESFGEPIERICSAMRRIAARSDVDIVWPLHPNPRVRDRVTEALRNVSGIHLIEPQPYLPFIELMNESSFIMTDSGGIQEEAPSLGKPVLVLRDQTERPEVVEVGAALLVGTDPDLIVTEASRLLDDTGHFAYMASRPNPFGDGKAAARIAARCVALLD